MNNDLISREDLKKEFAKHEDNKGYLQADWEVLIDNAPTVEDNWRFYYDHGYKQAERDLKRPQGEWVLQTYERFNSGNELYKYYCNKCGHKEEHAYSDSKLPNFCPNCGAKMKGGADMRGR